MGCTDCTKAWKLIELPAGSSKDAVKAARKEWSKNLHPDIWQNRPGWKGAANQLTNINVAIDHLLQCHGAGSSSYTSSVANPSVREAAVRQVVRQAVEDLRKANKAGQTRGGFVERYHVFTGVCVLIVLPLFLYLTTTLSSSRPVDASSQEPASFTLQPPGIPQSDASASSPTQAASVVEDVATVEQDVEQPEATPMTSSSTPVIPAAPAVPAMADEAQRKAEVSLSPRPAYVPVTTKVMEDPVVTGEAPIIRNQYGSTPRTAPVGYAAMQELEAQPTSRATTLILSNGTALHVTNVWYSGERILFTMGNGSHRFLGLEQVNFRSTIQANHQIGVRFNPPQSYPGN